MNTAKSVAYGWGALIVAAGIGYYFAKRENERRWSDQRARGLRSNEKLDWKDKVAAFEAKKDGGGAGDTGGSGGGSGTAAAS